MEEDRKSRGCALASDLATNYGHDTVVGSEIQARFAGWATVSVGFDCSRWRVRVGFYLLSRFESLADMKVYSIDRYIISGHSLEHLCLAMLTFILTVMLWLRSIKISRCQFLLLAEVELEMLLHYSVGIFYHRMA
ncbi:hypothetical protein IEQ34_021295 [Dendrobium chrysotoxum]|uniref:Uncharacterized protein n=1 Tax=Dendrobium chrysotoxum TaxID=161865 RepID=A0AAV7G5G9_DENCH|nr:hypothetical protein IEQ34_021295 [Dendrobium chrysotoxum]